MKSTVTVINFLSGFTKNFSWSLFSWQNSTPKQVVEGRVYWVYAFIVHRREGVAVTGGAAGFTVAPDSAKTPRYAAS